MMLPRLTLLGFAAVVVAVVVFALLPGVAQSGVNSGGLTAQQAGPVVVITGLSINPNPPPVGTNYVVTATVYSRHNRPVVVRGRVQLPQKDSVVTSRADVTIPAGGTVTLTWTVLCGEDGGTVRVAVDILREVR